jgi:hypothetical protein
MRPGRFIGGGAQTSQLRLTAQTETRERWLAYDPDHDWLPEIDLAALRREPNGRNGEPQSLMP